VDQLDNWVDAIAKRLSEGRYRTDRSARLRNGSQVDLVGSRTYFSLKGLVLLSQHIVVKKVENANVPDLTTLFDTAFRFGKKRNWIPLLRGMQFGYMIIPVIVTLKLQPELAEYATARPRKHWSLFEFPVVVEADTGRVEYFRGTALWGGFYFSDMRQVAERFIVGRP
jgi:hypothetical protein